MYTSKFVRVGENRVKADINMYSKLFKRFIGKHSYILFQNMNML